MDLPSQKSLPVHLLAGCLNNTSATYKFYWFLSLIRQVETNGAHLLKQDLFAEMIAHAWYTVNYFKVSFGKQDKLQSALFNVRNIERLTVDKDQSAIYNVLSGTTNKATVRELNYFNGEVPHRFLSPWFNTNNRAGAYAASQRFENQCLYALYETYIEINPIWIEYLQSHAGILRSFCYWKLALYLQKRNPSVPGIPSKLVKSPVRKSLNEQRKFWNIVIGELGSVDCIYTNKRLKIGDYAVEHFLPYAFVAHDLIWNIIPADHSFNSSKSDKLPPLDIYFESYFSLQRSALEIIKHKAPKNRFLEDYLTIVPDTSSFEQQCVLEQLLPMITIARNNGFEMLKPL
ncbi:hypothetical protein L0663_05100 [Dyadobacter sp. CY107]|uniref:HNH endonuclease domain-containing protein n=1 Tax=Dyadobacter fanqingshengii TaxID=2906443 RepID=UPI001F38EC54|nr:HNH endonuclease domain-containing protein [Dyadobacter fanqingshengii]MCF2502744.1 hypothetical protein [Dyadobacter fanqingshengii]